MTLRSAEDMVGNNEPIPTDWATVQKDREPWRNLNRARDGDPAGDLLSPIELSRRRLLCVALPSTACVGEGIAKSRFNTHKAIALPNRARLSSIHSIESARLDRSETQSQFARERSR